MKNFLKIFGIILIAIGLIGLASPFLHGLILIIIGIIFLSIPFPSVRYKTEQILNNTKVRYPKTEKFISIVEKIYRKILGFFDEK